MTSKPRARRGGFFGAPTLAQLDFDLTATQRRDHPGAACAS